MKQSQICRLENSNNSSWQIRTLKRIAEAFDLVLVVKFESFGAFLPDVESFSRRSLERPSHSDDPAMAVPQVIEGAPAMEIEPLKRAQNVQMAATPELAPGAQFSLIQGELSDVA
jgi:hypothetical protein